jgi:hypothetical protein
MIVFLDFEASSLSKVSFPIEVAWIFEDGRSRSYLIKPPADWSDWSTEAEGIHGISKAVLLAQGASVDVVAAAMIDDLSGHSLFASAPSWDGKWLSALLRKAGLPRHALRLRKSDEAFLAVARDVMADRSSEQEISELVADTIKEAKQTSPPAHRALGDAALELERWKLVREAAISRSHQA